MSTFEEGASALTDQPQLLSVGQRSWRVFVTFGDLMLQEAFNSITEQPFSLVDDPALPGPLAEYNVTEWQRWITEADCSSIRWRPMLPDLPLVVRPSSQLVLSPRAEVDIYLSLPLFVQLGGATWDEGVCLDASTVPLSKTWFGSPVRGEVAYALTSRARRNLDLMASIPCNRCICPTRFINETKETVRVSRLLIRCPQLHLYRGPDQRYWTSDTTVVVKSSQGDVEVKHRTKAPRQEPQATLIHVPRQKPGRLLERAWSFMSERAMQDG